MNSTNSPVRYETFFRAVAGEALKVHRGSISQTQASEALSVRTGFLTAQHLGRGRASLSNPIPTQTPQKAARFSEDLSMPMCTIVTV